MLKFSLMFCQFLCYTGGTNVESFLFSKLLPLDVRGSTYTNLFHVSDWFPTILNIAAISYKPVVNFELDGFDHVEYLMGRREGSPREYMLYNYYHNVEDEYFDLWINGTVAVRNSKYKLMHSFTSNSTNW